MSEDQLPDWLVTLRGQRPPEEPATGPVTQPATDWFAEPGEPQSMPEAEAGALEPAPAPDELAMPSDLLGDLREQIELPRERVSSARAGFLSGLRPQQRFVLALLLFFEVAICGCMALVLTERVVIP